MIESAIRQAMRRVGSRGEVLGRCPVCGLRVVAGEDRVRAWSGTYAHRSCALYHGRRHSHRVHDSFTAR
jgi:hypothetical protein